MCNRGCAVRGSMKFPESAGVLLVSCNPADTQLISDELAVCSSLPGEERFRVRSVKTVSGVPDQLQKGSFQAIIFDLDGSKARGLADFESLLTAARRIPILVLCDAGTNQLARQAVGRGAKDYILKSLLEIRVRSAVAIVIQQHVAEDAVHLQQQCAEATLSCTGDAVVICDQNGLVTYLNTSAELLTGWSLEEARGYASNEVCRFVDAVSRQPASNPRGPSRSRHQQGPPIFNGLLLRRDGSETAVSNCTAPIRDRDGQVTGEVLVFHDTGAARLKTPKLSHLAQHDVLTDLPNRLLLNDRINQAISFAARYHHQLAVMFVDLDHFKKINDTWGHAVGDKLLQSVSSRILACVRRSDTVSRHGGDEFVILLSQVEHAEDAVFIARKILSSLAAPYTIEQKHLYLNASIGVSTYPGDGQDADTLIQRADTAMYDAKKFGRNNCQFFRADMQARVQDWQSLEGNLRLALDHSEFTLHYQPKINLITTEVSGVEALLRWKHPERGVIQPMDFVPIAEESGLIVPIGQWVLQEACRQARAWIDAGLPAVRMAVNVSAVEFMSRDFLTGVRAALSASGIEPRNLELELTETVLMQDADGALATLKALKSIGVQLAVDDFGTGYSSFSYLRKFPLDSLKVDRSFISEISPESGNAAILSAMINIGKSLGHRVVAEGVETRSQLDFLQHSGCTEGQGYFFCYPVIAEKFAEFLESGVTQTAVH
jgi:diguanylate cyclase (GGDEF)-like protein/PAS domain S-box-containing protein